LVNRPEKSDSEFSWKDFIDKNNNELLANLGNLVHRVLKYIYKNYNKKIPAIKEG
jgi:methionyl-tRNA synthetase